MNPQIGGHITKVWKMSYRLFIPANELDARSVAVASIAYKQDKRIHTSMGLGDWVCSSYAYLEQINPFQPQSYQRAYPSTTCLTNGDTAHMSTVTFNRENLNLRHSQNTRLVQQCCQKSRCDIVQTKQVVELTNKAPIMYEHQKMNEANRTMK